MLFISPPFGNYLNTPNSISIRGSFTLYPRDGLFLQILKTLRYSFKHNGWVNQIGLRNKGIDYGIQTHPPNDVLSVAIQNKEDIPILMDKIPKQMNLELNVSCPNVGDALVQNNTHLKAFLNDEREWCIIKLSPHTHMEEITRFYENGFRQFHCCNTLPSENGGISGPRLRPYVIQMVKNIKSNYPDTTVIAGGGIRSVDDAQEYMDCGADHVSVSTLCFNPLLMGLFLVSYDNTNI